jgi:glycosyltransferase involved in cell wall biosynthesis
MSAGPRLHVLALVDSLGQGGAEFLLAEFAAAAPSAGIEVSVAYLAEKPYSPAAERLRGCGITPVHVPASSLLAPHQWLAVRRHLRRVRPDVLHTHLGTSDWIGGLAARSLSLPAVSTVHVMGWDRSVANDVKVKLIAAGRRRCMTSVIAVSDAAGRWLVAQHWARPDQVVTVHNGVQAERRPGAGPRIRRELGIPAQATVVMMLSVLRPEKGHDVGIEAVAELRRRDPDLHLVIVGDGPTRPDLETRAARLDGAVTMVGHRDDVMDLLDAADVLLHPSRIDAFPGALLEAMAAGVPPVATAVGGIPEIIDHGATGVLVPAPPAPRPLAEALEPLVRDRALREALSAAGRRRFLRDFSADRWAARTRAVYEHAIARAPLS